MTTAQHPVQDRKRVFISYGRSDQSRVDGLALLLEALGHEVFVDRRAIKPGIRWAAELRKQLDGADVLLVYWTKRAAGSSWVRDEYEHFHIEHPDRMLVPVLGDETPLTGVLSRYQQSDFAPLVNELLALKTKMTAEGAGAKAVQRAVLERLREAGIELDANQSKKLRMLFAPTGLLGLIAAPLVALKVIGVAGLEGAAQLSGAQAALLGAAAVSGAVIYGTVDRSLDAVDARTAPVEVAEVEEAETGILKEPDELGDRTRIDSTNPDQSPRFVLPKRSYLGQPPPFSIVYLSDLDHLPGDNVSRIHGGLQRDRVYWQNEVWMGGSRYYKALGMHAANGLVAGVSYGVPEWATWFRGLAGLARQDGNEGCDGNVVFRVTLNDAPVASRAISGTWATAPVNINVPVAAGQELTLEVTDGSDSNYCDHMTWGNPRFE